MEDPKDVDVFVVLDEVSNSIMSISSVRTLFEQIQLISRKGLNIIGDGFVK